MNQSKIFKFIGILIVIIAAVISGILYYKDYQAKKSLPCRMIKYQPLDVHRNIHCCHEKNVKSTAQGTEQTRKSQGLHEVLL
jgi:Tfp pilus assembly major pilin PilA